MVFCHAADMPISNRIACSTSFWRELDSFGSHSLLAALQAEG
jgi:hypothetical protein